MLIIKAICTVLDFYLFSCVIIGMMSTLLTGGIGICVIAVVAMISPPGLAYTYYKKIQEENKEMRLDIAAKELKQIKAGEADDF